MAIITISRPVCSGGAAVAERVAARLGYEAVSFEELLDSGRAYGMPRQVVEASMCGVPTLSERLLGHRRRGLVVLRAALAERARRDNLVY